MAEVTGNPVEPAVTPSNTDPVDSHEDQEMDMKDTLRG